MPFLDDWRGIGDTTPEVVEAELRRRASPLMAELGAVAAAVNGRGLGRLVLAILAKEQQYGTDTGVVAAALRNPLSLKARDGSGGWARFPAYAAGIGAGVERLLDPGGPYAATRTLPELFAVWAPASDGNDPAEYARFVERYAERYRALERRGALRWDPVPYPPMVDLVVAKPWEGAGFDRCAPRGGRIVGVCDHITAGEGSPEFYAAFFATGGERQADALVDTVIGRDGRIGLLNDWRDPERGGRRAGWANGGSDGLEGPGIEFVRRLGAAAINERLVSKEHVAREGEAITDAQMAASVALDVAVLQAARVPWHEYPVSSALGGIAVSYQHRHFARKSCPAEPWIGRYAAVKEREVKAGLARAQTGSTDPSPPPTETGEGEGVRVADLALLFGTLDRERPGGGVREYPFDPAGVISNAWLARARQEGVFPEADRWFVRGAKQFVTFANGWVLVAPRRNAAVHAHWRWIDGTDLVQEETAR